MSELNFIPAREEADFSERRTGNSKNIRDHVAVEAEIKASKCKEIF